MNNVELNDDGSYNLNIQPKAGILGIFSRLNYKPWYAIAEFVDNSTQSFYSHESELSAAGINSVNISIDYDFDKNILTITDDAFGMNLDEFSKAVQMDIEPGNKFGRNEFGMGLKTAASWFGNRWSVESCRFGDGNLFFTEVDIPLLRQGEENSIKITRHDCEKERHGTVIRIYDITKKIGAARTKGKIIDILESMYRRDINSQKINISFNDVPLRFEGYNVLDYKGKRWKKDVDLDFYFDDKKYHVKGFVGIFPPKEGSYAKGGFALFRRNRVVIGGNGLNYKPDKIFVQAQSPISHKLFGEFDLDDFPVNQAKDGFVWDNGLEDEFVAHLKEDIHDYIEIAKKTIKERSAEEEFSEESSEDIQKEVSEFTDHISNQNLNKEQSSNPDQVSTAKKTDLDLFEDYLNETNNEPQIIPDFQRNYTIKINPILSKIIKVKWSIGNDDYWISIDDSSVETEISVIINVNHSFFKPYSNNPEFKVVLEKLVIAFVVAEQMAKTTSNENGYIKSSLIRNNMNKYLSQIQGK